MIKRKKNPHKLSKEQILNHLKNNNIENIRFLREGSEGSAYYFNITKNTHIFDTLFKKGEYVLKIYKKSKHLADPKAIKYLTTLSNYGLIPKVYYIDSNTIIMKYINGIDEIEFIKKYGRDSWEYMIVLKKIEELEELWKKLGFKNQDLGPGNILITDNLNVHIIDPFDPEFLPI